MEQKRVMKAGRKSKAVMCVLVFAVVVMPLESAHAKHASYFDMDEQRSDNIRPFPKWTGMITRYDDQQDASGGDDNCGKVRFYPCSVEQWRVLMESMKNKPLLEQLDMVNNWGNQHPYIEDQINWGLEDFWETPNEFMEISGDCEDYAISKYYTLRGAGFAADRLRIIVLQDLNLGGVIHAVLGVYDGGELYILDNQSQQVIPAMKIYHYRPIFGINEESWWAYYPRQD